jgi:hypothetical protein
MLYSDEEIATLKESLKQPPIVVSETLKDGTVKKSTYFLYSITYHDTKITLIEIMLDTILRDFIDFNVVGWDRRFELMLLMTFFHKTPFKEIPLYVNTFPQLATWRLEIGK